MRKYVNPAFKSLMTICTALTALAPLAMAQSPNPGTSQSVNLVPYRDPWPSSKERWWDISNFPYNDWITAGAPNGKFGYSPNPLNPTQITPQVTLTYDTAPSTPYFVAHLDAYNLKPNFCYQLKLVGKPVYGDRGMGRNSSWVDLSGNVNTVGDTAVNGDDWANEKIGYAGRWWDDDNQVSGTNLDDGYYLTYYKNKVLANPNDTTIRPVYGYQFMGSFVTNSVGEVHIDFTGQYSYHIDWASWQGGTKQVFNGTFPIQGFLTNSIPTYYYAYGSTAPSTSVDLWYEKESGRANPVALPNGTYHCRFMLTEESFHNNLGGGTTGDLGGYWKSVLITEDFASDGSLITPDSDPANDVVFTINMPTPPAAPTGLSATASLGQVALAWNSSPGATGYIVKRSTTSGSGYTTIASSLTTTNFIDTQVTNGVNYYYVVAAANAAGTSGNSNQVQATTPLPAPSGLSASAASKTQIRISWTYNSTNTSTSGVGFMTTRPVQGQAKSSTPNEAVQKVILDTDIGDDVDDAYALVLMASAPNVQLLGVTTAFGQTKERAEVAAKLLHAMGRDAVPVYAGRRGEAKIGRQYDWARGYTAKALQTEPAIEFMKREIERAPNEITLVAVGPLVNLGDLLTRYPETKTKIKRIVIMGGAVYVGYNNQAPAEPEWNIRCDVAAARTVFSSGIPVVMAGLEVTTMMKLDEERRKKIYGYGTPTTDALAALTALWGGGTPTLYDPVAVAYALGQSFSESEQKPVVVEDNGLTRMADGPAHVTVLVRPRKDDFLNWYVEAVKPR